MSDADLYAVNFGAELLACETSHILSLMMYVLNKDELNDLLSISFLHLIVFLRLIIVCIVGFVLIVCSVFVLFVRMEIMIIIWPGLPSKLDHFKKIIEVVVVHPCGTVRCLSLR